MAKVRNSQTPVEPPSQPQVAAPRVRCVVARGTSPKVEVTFAGEQARTLRLGAARAADWWIGGRGAVDYALDLHWDGELLWVADRAGHGRATVDGERIGTRWRGLGGDCRLEFPGGALVVESSRPGVVTATAPRHAPLEAESSRSDVREVLRPPPTPERARAQRSREANRTQELALHDLIEEPADGGRNTLRGVGGARGKTVVPPPATRATLPGRGSPPPVPKTAEDSEDDSLSGAVTRVERTTDVTAVPPPPGKRRLSSGG